MATPVKQRVNKHREAMRAAGYRLIQIWVPDVNRPGFKEDMAREARLVAEADAKDPDLQAFMDANLDEALASIADNED